MYNSDIPLTPLINNNNISQIHKQVIAKKSYKPYFATYEDSSNIITDMDHFPYTRYYRGIYNESNPVILEREAGFRVTHNNCYSNSNNLYNLYNLYDIKNDICFQTACSTVLPCHNSNRKDKCIVLFR